MSNSLAENIVQAISDFDNIKQAIEDKGVTVGNVPTSDYAEKISQIKTGDDELARGLIERTVTELVIPNDVTSIGFNAFAQCPSLISVTIPNNAKSIGGYAFNSCVNLTKVTILSTETICTSTTFLNCTSLTDVTLVEEFNGTGLNLSWSPLTVDCMTNMFNALAELTGQTAKTLKLGATNLAKLTDEQKQIATNKNWNLA